MSTNTYTEVSFTPVDHITTKIILVNLQVDKDKDTVRDKIDEFRGMFMKYVPNAELMSVEYSSRYYG